MKKSVLLNSGTISFFSCTNEEIPSKSKEETNISIIENKEAILNELSDFTQYSIKGASLFYDSSMNDVDLEKLDNYILKFNFSQAIQSRSSNKGTINYEDGLKDILSQEAYDCLSSYLATTENITKDSFDKLKIEFSNFSKNDQEVFDLIYSSTYVIFNELTSIDNASSRATKNSTACNISMALCTSAAAWAWGAAFGGIVGVAVNVAWTVAGAVAAQYTC